MLKRGAFVAAAVPLWTSPVVQTIGMRAAAATPVADFCPLNQGTITSLFFRYTARGCDNLQPVTAVGRQRGCIGTTGPLPQTAFVVVNVGNCGAGGTDGPASETFAGTVTAFDTVIDSGIPHSPQPCTRFRVYTDSTRTTLLVDELIHTSCSQELNIGEQYGPLEIYDGTWAPN
jgi:hypothetical protein